MGPTIVSPRVANGGANPANIDLAAGKRYSCAAFFVAAR
jgi:hypothetical protein